MTDGSGVFHMGKVLMKSGITFFLKKWPAKFRADILYKGQLVGQVNERDMKWSSTKNRYQLAYNQPFAADKISVYSNTKENVGFDWGRRGMDFFVL